MWCAELMISFISWKSFIAWNHISNVQVHSTHRCMNLSSMLACAMSCYKNSDWSCNFQVGLASLIKCWIRSSARTLQLHNSTNVVSELLYIYLNIFLWIATIATQFNDSTECDTLFYRNRTIGPIIQNKTGLKKPTPKMEFKKPK